ncbi:MAG: FAD-binding protein [Patulibacter minatonensis]
MSAAAWTNWAGQQSCSPAVTAQPRHETDLLRDLADADAAGHTVRAVGSGHSFTDACLTGGMHVDLSLMSAVLDVDRASGLVRTQAGIPLHRLTAVLHEHGLALENQGDIDRQTIAGATATATHGTGARFRNLSSGIVGARIALADGTVRDLSLPDDEELLRAVRVSLGALGVVTELTLQTVPAFRLSKVEEPRPLDDLLDGYLELSAEHDHFECYVFPYAKVGLSMASQRTDAPAAPPPAWRRWIADDLLANRGLEAFSRAGRRAPHRAPQISRALVRLLSRDVRIDHSHLVYASERRVRFTEMEYAIPRERVSEAVRAVLTMIEARRVGVTFPIEVRTTAPDDAHLSTAHGRDTAYVAVHQFVGMPYEPYFREVEAIMDGFDGRPHWGKRHFQTAGTLAPRYSEWARFQAARAQLDPAGRFTNGYVRRVLGPPPAEATA